MIAIFVVALILFGPKKLPELGRTLGKALSEFRRAKNELKANFETHLHELEREARLSDWQSSGNTPDYSSPRYPYPYDEHGRSGYDESHRQDAVAPAVTPETDSEPASQNAPAAGTVPRTSASHAGAPVSASKEQDRAV